MALDQIIPGIIGLLLFGGPTAYLLWLLIMSLLCRSWPQTTGTINISIFRPGRRRDQGTASVRYEYEVAGTTYTGSTVYFGDFIDNNAGITRRLADRYRVGAQVPVYYFPRRPGIATLEARSSGCLLGWIGLGLLMTGSIVYGWITGT